MTELPTIEERDLLRSFAFDEWQHWSSVTEARIAWDQLDIDALTDNYRDSWTDDQLIDMRGIEVEATKVEVVPSPLRSVIVSPRRFIAWLNTYRRIEVEAVDAGMAAIDANLADLDSIGRSLYVVTPCMSTADWEYLKHLSPAPETSHRALPDATHTKRYCTCEACRTTALDALSAQGDMVRGRGGEVEAVTATLVPVGMVEATSLDPGRWNRQAQLIERACRMFFASHGEQHPSADRLDKTHGRFHSRPDRVAFRGQVRFQRPSPCRVETKVTDRTEVAADGRIELATRLTRLYYCSCEASTKDLCKCDRRGWKGHRAVIFPLPKRTASRKATKASRKATGSRGKATTAWSMSDRSLARVLLRLADQREGFRTLVESIEKDLRTLSEGETISYGECVVTMLAGSSTGIDSHRGAAYPVRGWARRRGIEVETEGIEVE